MRTRTKRSIRRADALASRLSRLRWRGRELWRQSDRVHLALGIDAGVNGLVRRRIEAALEALPGVRWARVSSVLGCVVVDVDREVCRAETLEETLAAVERPLGDHREPVRMRHPERHPGDAAPVVRLGVQLAAEVLSLAGAGLLRRLDIKPLPIELDAAALLELAATTPVVRKAIERVTGVALAEIAFELSAAALRALVQSAIGSVAGCLHVGLRLRELSSRRALWARWEPRLCDAPEKLVEPAAPPVRPRRTPRGPVEQYVDKATLGSLVAFASSAISSRELTQSLGWVFAGVPKPAKLGRESFAAHLGHRLADTGVLVVEPQALRKLDRIDCVVIDGETWDACGAELDVALAAFASRDARVVVAEPKPGAAIPSYATESRGEGSDIVRELQRAGHGVCAVGCGPWSGLAAADCGVGIVTAEHGPPWGAHIMFDGGGRLVGVVFEAIAAARRASEEGVYLSGLEAAVGLGLSLSGLAQRTTRRIMAAAGAASILALANGMRHAQAIALGPTRATPPSRDTPPGPRPWHAMSPGDVIERLGSSIDGLDAAQVTARRRPPPPRPSAVRELAQMVAAELANPMAPVLGAGMGLSLLAGGVADAALIGSVVLINAAIGGAQRFRASAALARLGERQRRPVRVRRGGQIAAVFESEVVVGDIVLLSTGDLVPADCRVVRARGVEVDESSLTGESLPVLKSTEPVASDAIAERASMLYDGTSLAAGEAEAVVVAAGDDTEARRAIAATVSGPRTTGVEARLERLTALTTPVAAISGLAVGGASLLRGRSRREAISGAVSLAVAAVPEGLPLLATMAQLAAADRLASRGALVREPRAIEALGRVNVLCADKTGTLTEGRMTLQIVSDGTGPQPVDQLDARNAQVLATALCASPSADAARRRTTDRALFEAARRLGVDRTDELNGWTLVHELPFVPERGYHAALVRRDTGHLLSVKGAPEVVLPRCSHRRALDADVPLRPEQHRQLIADAVALARRGYRVLAVADRDVGARSSVDEDALRDMRFRGFIGFSDPVRDTARAAVRDLRSAGVSIVMLTGDHPSTAESIASDLDIRDGQRTLTGAELEAMDDDELQRIIGEVAVFARVTPAHKVRIVRALQNSGHTVAMTGDGANDAAAIRLADVGIAFGAGSAAAARHAADVVITDERIETIISATLEGRALWAAVRDAVSVLVGGNVGEIAFTLAGGLFGGLPPLNARQLLLVNLVTDTLPALAMVLRPPPTRSPDALLREGPDASLGRALGRDILWRAGTTAGAAGAAWLAARLTGTRARASTVAMLALSGSQLAQTVVLGAGSRTVVAAGVGSLALTLAAIQTPGVSHFFGCRPLGPLGLAQAGLAIAASTAVAALQKWGIKSGGAPPAISRERSTEPGGPVGPVGDDG